MKYRFFLSTLLVLLFGVQASAQEQRPAMVKTTKAVQAQRAATAQMVGTLYFERTSRVSPEEQARITRVNFKEGDRVKKGDILIRMDSRLLETELALQKARQDQVRTRMKKTKLKLDRYTELYKKDIATASDYDDYRLTYEEQHQELAAISRQADMLTIRLSKHVVKAPFDGIVLEKKAEVGEWTRPGDPICVLGASNAIYARIPMAEHLAGFTRSGDRIPLVINAFNHEIFGVMEGVRPIADPKTKNLSLKLHLDYQGPVAVNMSVTARVPVSEQKPVILLPRDALVQVRGQDMVYAVNENKAQIFPIEIIAAQGKEIGVVSPGLKPGMTVVIEGNERLQPGQAVSITGEMN